MDINDYWYHDNPNQFAVLVDEVYFVQPIGFVWFSKPRYRIKAGSNKREKHEY